MIYTVTFNPALDYILKVKELKYDNINRSYFEDIHYGGKGINVSVMLTRLGIPNRALGFIAGFTGDRLREMLENEGVDCQFLKLETGNTRINVKIKSNTQLDINAKGPEIGDNDIERLLDLLKNIKSGDFLVLAGSMPRNLPDDIYEKILFSLNNKDIKFVVDTTGESLRCALKYKPFLVKPNQYELGDLFGVKVKTDEDVEKYAKELKEKGALNVLVSLGDRGAVLLDEKSKTHNVGTVAGHIVNTVGCGDSMVAGFLAGYIKTGDYKEALMLGDACGNATAFCNDLASGDSVLNLFDKLHKTTI